MVEIINIVKEEYMKMEITMRLTEAWDGNHHEQGYTKSLTIYCMWKLILFMHFNLCILYVRSKVIPQTILSTFQLDAPSQIL